MRCHLGLGWRETQDLDVSVSVSLDELAARLERLPGLRQRPEREHEWQAPDGVRLDVLPAGPALLAAGEIVWPRSGSRMSLLGFRLAFEQRQRQQLPGGLSVDVAPLAVVGLLKMVAYQDRPHERERDLQDLAHILDDYLAPDDDRRAAADLYDAGVGFDQASAYAFGRDLGIMVDPAERTAVKAFLARLRDERDPWRTLTRMARLAPIRWRGDEEAGLRLARAFEDGFQRSRLQQLLEQAPPFGPHGPERDDSR